MNYEKIIIELLSRIQTLEEKVDLLMSNQGQENTVKANDESRGEEFIVLRASNLHRINKLRNSMPMVCNAMRQCMGDNDIVLHETPSGYSSSLEIQYML